MKRVLGLSGIKSLDLLKSSSGTDSVALNAKMISPSVFVSLDSSSSGSFTNLKHTADKLVKEHASAKRNLELANSKLKKLMEQIHSLEEKLQNAFNENVRLKMKQKEDEKMWKGLESKFSSTQTLCNQVNETLQLLTAQVRDAEKDKAFFEEKLFAASVILDKLHEHMESISLRLESSEETVKSREKALTELVIAKERMEASLKDENKRAVSLIKDKDCAIEQLNEAVAVNKVALECMTSKMENLYLEVSVKEDSLLEMRNLKETLERNNLELLCSKNDFASRLGIALNEIKALEGFFKMLVMKLMELENQSLIFAEKVVKLTGLSDLSLKLAQKEKDLAAQCAQQKFVDIHHKYTCATSERNSLQLHNQELNDKILELQKAQDGAMAQHANECCLAEDRILKLESEAKMLLAKQTEMKAMISVLEANAKISLENSRLSDQTMQDLLLKLSELENESESLANALKADILKKQNEIDFLQEEMQKKEDNVKSLEKMANELNNDLKEKDQIFLELKTREKHFEDQKTEIEKLLSEKERKLEEAKKQHDQILESKQMELSKHLKEISQRNDQAINDMRKKYETDKHESINLEKEKTKKLIQDLENQYELKIAGCKEESRQHLLQIHNGHVEMLRCIQKEHDNKEMGLIEKHKEEIKRLELQAGSELRERLTSLRSEHETHLRALRCEHEDECRRLQEELDIQKAKEERQRTLLQMQWKAMSDNPQDEEVNSKKIRIADAAKRNQHTRDRIEDEEKDLPYLKSTETPVQTSFRKENPKQSRKVTHHEYEIETSKGRTIKRKNTRSTVMFESDSQEPRKQRKRETPKARRETPRVKALKDSIQGVQSGGLLKQSNIGDLFSEGSLNPYADDPYAFD